MQSKTKDFNPRLQEGGDAEHRIIEFVRMYFNPRLQEGGDLNQTYYVQHWMQDFNPRLQEGGDEDEAM